MSLVNFVFMGNKAWVALARNFYFQLQIFKLNFMLVDFVLKYFEVVYSHTGCHEFLMQTAPCQSQQI